MTMTRARLIPLVLSLLLVAPVSGCAWIDRQYNSLVNGDPIYGKPIPGFTAAQAKERIAGYLKDSLQGFPTGVFYASYGPDGGPGGGGFGGHSSQLYDSGPAQESPFYFSVIYWVHFPEGSGTAEEWFDRLVGYWSAHAKSIPAAAGVASSFLRYASFTTSDHYSFEIDVNRNHDLAIHWTSPYYAYEVKDTGDLMPETITKNGYSAFGEPPK